MSARLLCLLLALCAAHAQWQSVRAPQEGNIRALASAPTHPDRYFALSMGVISRSIDQGETWTPVFSNVYQDRLLVAPSNGDIVYTDEWKSLDAGQSWMAITPMPHYMSYGGAVVHPGDPLTVYSLDYYNGVFVTHDGAATWLNLGLGNIGPLQIHMAPANPATIYVVSADRIYKSLDGGANWNLIYEENEYHLTFNTVGCLLGGSLILGQTSNINGPVTHLVRSDDDGQSWSTLGLTPEQYPISQITDVEVDGDHLLACTDAGLYRSGDDGGWTRITADYDRLKCVHRGADLLVGAESTGIRKWRPDLDLWYNVGPEPMGENDILITASSALEVATHRMIGGVFFYRPDLDRWIPSVPPGGGSYDACVVGIPQTAPSTVYCVSQQHLYRSTDLLSDWQLLGAVPGRPVGRIEISADEQKFFLIDGSNLVRSLNGGQSWSTLPLPGGNGQRDWHRSQDGRLYLLSTVGGFFVSTDDGNTWTTINEGLEGVMIQLFTFLEADPISDDLYTSVFTGNGLRVFCREPGQTQWSSTSGGNNIMTRLVCRPDDGSLYGIVTDWTNVGLYRSADRGASWQIVDANLPDDTAWRMDFIRRHPSELWLVDPHGSLWSKDLASTSLQPTPIPATRPARPELTEAWPNPFNPQTRTTIRLPEPGPARLTLHDALGRQCRVLLDVPLPAGELELAVDGTGLASGVYILRLEAGNQVVARKILLLR